MPTTLSPISNTAITVRWKEPYASDALNRKLSAVIPAGVYRGLRLEVSAVDLSVDVAEDSTYADHVAVFDTDDGHSITYRDNTSGRLTFDLSSFLSGETVIISVSAGYSIGVDTTAEFLGYTQVEFDALTASQRSGIVVLGTVLRSAAGIIPVANISHDERDISFINRASESVPWNPLIRNSGFEISDTNETFRHASPFWETFNAATTKSAFFLSLATDVDSNSGSKSLEVSASVVGGVISTARQVLYTPVTPGRSMRVSLHKRAIQAATGTNSGIIRLSFEDKDGGSDTDVDLNFDVDAIDGSFVELLGVVTVPASMAVLKTIEVIVTGTYAGTGACIRIDDVQVWYEVDAGEWLAMNSSLSSEVSTDSLIVGNRALGIDAAKLLFDGVNLVVESRDPGSTAPGIAVGGIIASDIDLGSNLLSTIAQADTARIVAPVSIFAGVEYTLMWESVPAGGEGYRKYVSPSGGLVETVNAVYDNTSGDWTKDVGGEVASRVDQYSTGGHVIKTQVVGTNTWADGAWLYDSRQSKTDRNGRIRSYWGPEGYMMGPAVHRIYEVDKNAQQTGPVSQELLPMGLHVDADTNTEVGQSFPVDGTNAPVMNFTIDDIATTQGCNCYRRFRQSGLDSLCAVMEFRLKMDAIGSNGVNIWIGLRSDNVTTILPGTTYEHVGLQKKSTDTNWQQSVGDKVGELQTDTTVPPVVNVYQTFRIEYHGLLTPLGVANANKPVARYFIDGTLVGEDTGPLVPEGADNGGSAGMALCLAVFAASGGPSGDFRMTTGPIHYAYNEVLDPFVPVF